ncbi:Heart- and neural crest derivatives-expressed protein 2 [Orchesella cincta]|uniref:Heart-and neural crest derivatives-expressed protein 2 n=1 Tax=Orchesella cincta TaxID=48709 RepID=A0A1D2MLA3_ORCCI|nr:Heart- and neural crest derivatives-expressed protein 2 [Orchesella cincta]
MNCQENTPRNSRYSEFSSDGWCAPDDYYNENYLPNDSHVAMSSGQQPPYNNYYEYQGVNASSSAPQSQPVSSFPQKRSPSEEMYSSASNRQECYEPKSPSSASSSWNFHSFYQKNPSPSNSIIGSPGNPGSDSSKLPRPSFKRRTTANKKERRRTQSINNAFAELRDCIPNVPADTKLSKIKTLRLATSYIAYLSEVLTGDDPLRTPQAFTAEISKKMGRGDEKRRKELLMQELAGAGMKRSDDSRKSKGRTGWPQHVWALELQQ